MGVVVGAALCPFLGWLAVSCVSAQRVSREFVLAMQTGHSEEARALAGEALQRSFGPANDDPARTLRLLRLVPSPDVGVVQFGLRGDAIGVPFGCFDGQLADGKRYWIVAEKRGGPWKIVDVRSDAMPSSCEGSE